MSHLSDLEETMGNTTDISENDLFLDQENETANNIAYNITQENCNSEEGSLWPYASFPILIVSLVLGQLLRNIDSNLEFIQTSFCLIITFV